MRERKEKDNMVLYSVVTTYQLLEGIIHKLNYNREKSGVLMLSQWLVTKYPWYEKLLKFYGKVIVFDGHYSYSELIETELNKYFTELFEKNNVNIDEFEQIHVFGAEHSFGAYVFANGIKNYYWEEGAGALSKKDSMLELFAKAHGEKKAKYQYEKHLGDGETEFVVNRYYDSYFQLKEVVGDNLIHFDIAEELEKLAEVDREEVIKLFYGEDKIVSEQTDALLLTECFANLSIMTWEEQLNMYKYLVDYFLEEYQLLIKPHPDDIMYYEYEFERSRVIRTRFPAELLPFIFKGKPGAVATSSSTSIYGLRKRFTNVLEFNFKFSHEKQFGKLNRYFVALSIADVYIRKGYKLNLLGVNTPIIDNFYKFKNLCTQEYKDYGANVDVLYNDEQKNIWIVDEMENPHKNSKAVCDMLQNLPADDLVIFINSDECYCFYDYNYKKIWKDIQPIEIKINSLTGKDNTVTFAGPSENEDKQEMIYVYLKGAKVEMYEIKRELPNVGVSVTAKDFDGDKMQIKILEGMLCATEKRLKYYIERESELLSRLEE